MIITGYKSLPVVVDDSLVGFIAREDIVRALRQAAQGNLPARWIPSNAEALTEASRL